MLNEVSSPVEAVGKMLTSFGFWKDLIFRSDREAMISSFARYATYDPEVERAGLNLGTFWDFMSYSTSGSESLSPWRRALMKEELTADQFLVAVYDAGLRHRPDLQGKDRPFITRNNGLFRFVGLCTVNGREKVFVLAPITNGVMLNIYENPVASGEPGNGAMFTANFEWGLKETDAYHMPRSAMLQHVLEGIRLCELTKPLADEFLPEGVSH